MDDFLVQLNKDQLDKGEDSRGSFLGTYRPATYVYAEQKGRPKTQPDINLLDTGAFRNSIVSNVIGGSLIMEAADERKNSILIREFGQFIIGIPEDEMKTKVADRLYSILMPKITNLLENA
jgi:hypothetical protein